MQRWKRRSLGGGIFVVIVGLYAVSQQICIPALFSGMSAQKCPTTEVIPKLSVVIQNVRRGESSKINFQLDGQFLSKSSQFENFGSINRFVPTLALKTDNGEITSIELTKVKGNDHQYAFDTPLVEDGHYAFLAEAKSAYGSTTTNIPVDFFANAIGHLMTDRPLYEPNQTIKARVLLLNSRQMNPLANRVGQWRLITPGGQVLIEKERRTEPWGVSAVEFHLSNEAPTGQWTIEFESGDFLKSQKVTVEPFTLPRFTVTSETNKTHYLPMDKPELEAVARYASGAPVQKANVEVVWSMDKEVSEWMPPISWNDEKKISRKLKTDSKGKFKLELPKIPNDLVGQAAINIQFKVTDDAGETIWNGSKLKLSKDPIQLEALTEWGGLSEGVNNRLFIRVATPDNVPLRNHGVTIKRSWDNTDSGIKTQTDKNGIALVQLDPGKPINVVKPSLPYRPSTQAKAVAFEQAVYLSNSENIPIGDQIKLEQLESKLNVCRRYVSGYQSKQTVNLNVFIKGNGIVAATNANSPVRKCMAKAVKSIRFKTGTARIINISYVLPNSSYPNPTIRFWDGKLSPWNSAWEDLKFDARTCLKDKSTKDSAIEMSWFSKPNSKKPEMFVSSSTQLSTREESCIANKFRTAQTASPRTETLIGGLTITFKGYKPSVPEKRPMAETFLGYELSVFADGLGSSSLYIKNKPVPNLRIRTSPNITIPGETVTFEFIRGPNFGDDLPKTVSVIHPDGQSTEHALDSDTRKVNFKVPDKNGWYTTELYDVTGHFFVPLSQKLEVDLSTSTKSYRPGTRVSLNIDVKANGEPIKSAVGLFGVDKSLGELGRLETTNDFTESLQFIAESHPQAEKLGLSATALQQGLITGKNAQLAAMSLINSTPTVGDKESIQTLYGTTELLPEQSIADSFFFILEEMHAQVFKWESNAQPHEQFKPETVLSLWDNALVACETKEHTCSDMYGQTLTVEMLPTEYLHMIAPNNLVLDGSRLPEDMVNWIKWVKEKGQ
ncbi:MAG: MG2 domain-containing protein [Myxococcota bacterium]